MEFVSDTLILSRLQFAVTALFHMLWPLLTVGLSLFIVILEGLWLKKRDRDYYVLCRFWMKLFLLNFAVGVISGITMEFEFGTNWAPFSRVSGEFFGNILGYDGAMSLMLEAGFLGIMLFGWNRVPSGMHWFATIMVAFGSSLSAFWIMIANGWMHVPSGGHIESGRFVVDSYKEALLNPYHYWAYFHMWLACVATSLFVVGGLSAWYLLKNRHVTLFKKSLAMALVGLVLIMPLQVVIGDVVGLHIFETQPAKAAAIEGHWETNPPGQGADWNILAWPNKVTQSNDWAISIPNALSFIIKHDWSGQIRGLKEFPQADQPPMLPLIFYSFRVMVGIGFALTALVVASAGIAWQRARQGNSEWQPAWMLKVWVAVIPLCYIATECGWITREVGRQPWIIYGLLRTEDAVSQLPANAVLTSLVLFVIIYLVLLFFFLAYALKILKKGPDVDAALPNFGNPVSD